MLIDLIRHGEPVGGARYRGNRIDDPLSEKGWAQMRSAVDLEQPLWTHIISSPLIRCSHFAEELAVQMGIEHSIEPAFKEIGFGAWEGKNKQQLRQERAVEFEKFYSDPVNNTPEGAEAVSEFLTRISRGLESLGQKYSNDHLLLVAHAGVIRATITIAIGADAGSMYRIEVKNAGISRIELSQKRTSLVFHNC